MLGIAILRNGMKMLDLFKMDFSRIFCLRDPLSGTFENILRTRLFFGFYLFASNLLQICQFLLSTLTQNDQRSTVFRSCQVCFTKNTTFKMRCPHFHVPKIIMVFLHFNPKLSACVNISFKKDHFLVILPTSWPSLSSI